MFRTDNDITEMVDWALQNNYLPVLVSVTPDDQTDPFFTLFIRVPGRVIYASDSTF